MGRRTLQFSIFFFGMLFALPLFVHAELIIPSQKYLYGVPIKILIVPGHDNDYSGAVFGTTKEADMNLALANAIRDDLADDPQLEVTVARDEAGYIPELAAYFADEEDAIWDFIDDHKKSSEDAIESGDITVSETQVVHNDAPATVAFRLYGINKWAGEQGYDLVLHIHFNDAYPRAINDMGVYGGYAIYVPDAQLPNALLARPFGMALGNRLGQTLYPSNLPAEAALAQDDGLIEDLSLIALGARSTLSVPSILVEYSYIYEPDLSGDVFALTKEVLARATEKGMYDYFRGFPSTEKNLVYSWEKDMKTGTSKSNDIVALQYALKELGFFPPAPMTRDDCPVTGIFGPCTKAAAQAFQKANGLSPDGVVGPKSREKLNALFAKSI